MDRNDEKKTGHGQLDEISWDSDPHKPEVVPVPSFHSKQTLTNSNSTVATQDVKIKDYSRKVNEPRHISPNRNEVERASTAEEIVWDTGTSKVSEINKEDIGIAWDTGTKDATKQLLRKNEAIVLGKTTSPSEEKPAQAAKAFLDSQSIIAEWFLTDPVAKHKGPFSLKIIQEMIDNRSVNRNSLIWREGLPGWVNAETIPGLNFPPSPLGSSASEYWQPVLALLCMVFSKIDIVVVENILSWARQAGNFLGIHKLPLKVFNWLMLFLLAKSVFFFLFFCYSILAFGGFGLSIFWGFISFLDLIGMFFLVIHNSSLVLEAKDE